MPKTTNGIILSDPVVLRPYRSMDIDYYWGDAGLGICTTANHSLTEDGRTLYGQSFARITKADSGTKKVINEFWNLTNDPVCIGITSVNLKSATTTTNVVVDGVSEALTKQTYCDTPVEAVAPAAHLVGTEYLSPMLSNEELSTLVKEDYSKEWSDVMCKMSRGDNITPSDFEWTRRPTVSKLISDGIEYSTDSIISDEGWGDKHSLSIWRDTISDLIVVEFSIDSTGRSWLRSPKVIAMVNDNASMLSPTELSAIETGDLTICRQQCEHILRKRGSLLSDIAYSPTTVSVVKTPTDCSVQMGDHILAYTHAPSFMMFGATVINVHVL